MKNQTILAIEISDKTKNIISDIERISDKEVQRYLIDSLIDSLKKIHGGYGTNTISLNEQISELSKKETKTKEFVAPTVAPTEVPFDEMDINRKGFVDNLGLKESNPIPTEIGLPEPKEVEKVLEVQ
jgi:hypothetical protein